MFGDTEFPRAGGVNLAAVTPARQFAKACCAYVDQWHPAIEGTPKQRQLFRSLLKHALSSKAQQRVYQTETEAFPDLFPQLLCESMETSLRKNVTGDTNTLRSYQFLSSGTGAEDFKLKPEVAEFIQKFARKILKDVPRPAVQPEQLAR